MAAASLRPQCQPCLDGPLDSASGKNRLESRRSLSYVLLTNRETRERGNREAYDPKELPLDSLENKTSGRT